MEGYEKVAEDMEQGVQSTKVRNVLTMEEIANLAADSLDLQDISHLHAYFASDVDYDGVTADVRDHRVRVGPGQVFGISDQGTTSTGQLLPAQIVGDYFDSNSHIHGFIGTPK